MKYNNSFYTRLAWAIILTGIALGVGVFLYCVKYGL